MKKSKFTESQIIGILKEQEQGKKVVDLCREHGISQPTFYQWKSKYSGLDVNQLKRVKELEGEVSQYKRLVAELTLDNRILKDLNSKKILGPCEKRQAVAYSQESYAISLRKACRLVGTTPSVVRYKPKPKDDESIRVQLRQMADLHSRWGFWMMYHRLRALNFKDNNKRVYRIYTDMRLNLRRKYKKRLPMRIKQPLVQPLRHNLTWSMDFVHDGLFQGKPFRAFNIIDDFNREVLSIAIDTSLTSQRVVRELNKLIDWRGRPEQLRVDNGPEFIAQALQDWCGDQTQLIFIQKGKPHQNGFVERFNRTYRDEVLDLFAFESLNQARLATQAWMWVYNNERPHSSLGYLTPHQFLLKYGKLHNQNFSKEEFPTFQQDVNYDWNFIVSNVTKEG